MPAVPMGMVKLGWGRKVEGRGDAPPVMRITFPTRDGMSVSGLKSARFSVAGMLDG